jgi:hypothetical protein
VKSRGPRADLSGIPESTTDITQSIPEIRRRRRIRKGRRLSVGCVNMKPFRDILTAVSLDIQEF